MSTVLRPVGPQPERVYWIRRLVVVAALLVVVVVVAVAWSAFSGGRAGAADATETETGDTTGGTDAAAAETDTGPVACTPAELALALTANAQSYPAPGQPVLKVAVTNTGATSCTLDAADPSRVIVVTSGSDRIWSSADCPGEVVAKPLLLDPGARWEEDVTWARARSAEGCATGLAEPRPGTYTATLSWLGATSAGAVFDLT